MGDGRAGKTGPGTNFLVRTRGLFVAQGVATAVIDTPSDEAAMPDVFRMSARHAQDVAALVADLKARYPGLPVHLVGTSRGTPYAGAQALAGSYPLISVRGGDAARSDSCEAFAAHGYLGMEAPTVLAITQWIKGEAYAREVP